MFTRFRSACLLTCLMTAGSSAATLLSQGAATYGTGFYDAGSETFPFANLVDGLFDDTGSPSNWSFYLGRDSTLENVVVDLGANYTLSSFTLQNTHNRGYNDRGTNGFSLYASTAAPTANDATTFGTLLVTGNLDSVFTDPSSIPTQTFGSASTVGRYVTFQMNSFYGAGGGLNELQVFGDPLAPVPEPGTLLLIGAGLVALAARKRQRAA